jgi:hypothetical protein
MLRLSHLEETNIVGLFTEAASANVHLVLSDQTMVVTTNAASSGALSVVLGVSVPRVDHFCFYNNY